MKKQIIKDPIAEVKKDLGWRWKYYCFIADTKIKLIVLSYNIIKYIFDWCDRMLDKFDCRD